jgi:hypothetical protein
VTTRDPLENGTTALPVLVIAHHDSHRQMRPRQTPDLLLGTWSLLQNLGRCRRLIWDNEAVDAGPTAGVGEFCGRWQPPASVAI